MAKIRINTSSRLYRLLGNAENEPPATGCQILAGILFYLVQAFFFVVSGLMAVISLGSLILLDNSLFSTEGSLPVSVYLAGIAGWTVIGFLVFSLRKLCNKIEIVDDRSHADCEI